MSHQQKPKVGLERGSEVDEACRRNTIGKTKFKTKSKHCLKWFWWIQDAWESALILFYFSNEKDNQQFSDQWSITDKGGQGYFILFSNTISQSYSQEDSI